MAAQPKTQTDIEKKKVGEYLHNEKESTLRKYQNFYIGSSKFMDLVGFELAMLFTSAVPGALGLVLRKTFMTRLFKHVGSGVVLGRNLSLRHPGNISIGARTAIDENCLLDGKGAGDEGVVIGEDVVIARDTIIQAKTAPISIGNHSVIGSQTQLSSAGGIHLGKYVMIAGQCYIGGGRYRTEDRETPMMKQQLYTNGPVVIEDDVWIGAGVTIQDGVTIGKGSIIGGGATVREDVPPNTVLVPSHRAAMMPRFTD